jgi:hypothetical protein
MPLDTIPLPYGCRDIHLYPITGDTPATVGIDLPNARTLQFAESEQFTDLRGDDALKATHGQGPQVDWSLESGGVPFEAIRAMFGGTVTTTGTTPSQVKTYHATGTKQRPYFQVQGQALSDSGGDFQVVIYKCKCTGDLTGTMSDSNFWLSGTKGTGLADVNDNLYDFIQHETPLALT